MMKQILLGALASVAMLTAAAPADARDGCGPGFHRGFYGECHPNRGPGPLLVAPGLAIGAFYPGRGYWDGHRYWGHRYAWHRGWRYH
jgi:hypothetical protein